MRSSRISMLALGLLLYFLQSPASGLQPDDAVVIVEGCSGVCVHPVGLVLTAKHCELPTSVSVRFKDRGVPAQQVYVSRDTEGPVGLAHRCSMTRCPILSRRKHSNLMSRQTHRLVSIHPPRLSHLTLSSQLLSIYQR